MSSDPINANTPQTKPLKQILVREVDRKEFIGLMGAGLITIMGFDRIINLLNLRTSHGHSAGASASTTGYSGGAYGGSPNHSA